jgi:predicted transcriptional regulator
MQPGQLQTLDEWIEKQREHRSRPEAIRQILERALRPRAKPKLGDAAAQAGRHADAERAAHDYIDNALKHEHEDVRAARKKQLTTMPGGTKRR